MKVIAINTSPEKEWGVISLLLDPYIEGLKDAGAEVEMYYSRDLLIFPCCGNLNCTVRTPGNCMAFDDVRWLRSKIGQADVLVLASPLYFNGFTGKAGVTEPMTRLHERLETAREFNGDPYEHAVHTTHEAVRLRKVVVVSGCGFWEIDDFYPVLTHLKAICYNTFPELAGSITGPVRATVRGALPEGVLDDEIIAIARVAGRGLARDYRRLVRQSSTTMACDGRTEASRRGPEVRASDVRREWSGEMLFELGCMH